MLIKKPTAAIITVMTRAAAALLAASLSGCLLIPIPLGLLHKQPDSAILNSTETDREIVELLPPELALDYLNTEARNEQCAFANEGVVLANNTAYGFDRFVVNEVRLAGGSERFSVFLFARDRSRTDGLVCSWQQLDPAQSEKLITSLASLGIRYR